MKLMKIKDFQRFGKQSFPKLSKNEKGLEKGKLFQEKTKECFDFAAENVCKICGCKNGSCDCEMKVEEETIEKN